ncbi:hypothetical protein GZH53_01940 [Flavihumibacter sp. R14]|nr:hypothetical protein [Flavihumibacter soli]
MSYSEHFRYDEVSVFTENGTKYCMPVWAYQTELNIKVNTNGIEDDMVSSFNDWAESRKFPLFCTFDLPAGIYSAYLFKTCEDSEKVFGIDISHYEYKGKNPSLPSMNLPAEDCPFDEVLPVPKQVTHIFGDPDMALNSEYVHLESLLTDRINEAGMRKLSASRLADFKFNFPKYLYN